jgi:hypothetical protein
MNLLFHPNCRCGSVIVSKVPVVYCYCKCHWPYRAQVHEQVVRLDSLLERELACPQCYPQHEHACKRAKEPRIV